MKLSNEIKDVLSNFQGINSNIALGEDNELFEPCPLLKH